MQQDNDDDSGVDDDDNGKIADDDASMSLLRLLQLTVTGANVGTALAAKSNISTLPYHKV